MYNFHLNRAQDIPLTVNLRILYHQLSVNLMSPCAPYDHKAKAAVITQNTLLVSIPPSPHPHAGIMKGPTGTRKEEHVFGEVQWPSC